MVRQKGVIRAEEMRSVAGCLTLTCLFVGVFLLGLSTAIESTVTYALLPYITSAFAAHSMMSTVQIVSNSTRTIVYPISAKVADVFGRVEALTISLILIIAGYICMGYSANVWLYCLSQACYVAGQASISIMLTLIIADNSSLANRVLLSCVPNIPYLMSGWIGPPIAQAVLKSPGWRFGILIWAIAVPIAAACLVVTLIVMRFRARKLRNVEATESADYEEPRKSTIKRFCDGCVRLDLIGLILFGIGLIFTLVPFTLNSANSKSYFVSYKFILPVLGGVAFLLIFVIYDKRYAKFPIISTHILHNRSVLAACTSGFFYFMAFYIFDLYVTSFYQVAKYASVTKANYINSIFSFVSTCAGVCSGIIIKCVSKYIAQDDREVSRLPKQTNIESSQIAVSVSSASGPSSRNSSSSSPPSRHSWNPSKIKEKMHPYMGARKALHWLLVTGMSIYLLGLIGFAISVFKDASIGWMVAAMVVISVGGGLYTTPLTASVQATTRRDDMGSATALILTITLLGGSVGSAISGAVWTNHLHALLVRYLPIEYKFIADQISEDMSAAMNFAAGTPVREAINRAYRETVGVLAAIAVSIGAVIWVATLFVRPHKHVPTLLE